MTFSSVQLNIEGNLYSKLLVYLVGKPFWVEEVEPLKNAKNDSESHMAPKSRYSRIRVNACCYIHNEEICQIARTEIWFYTTNNVVWFGMNDILWS